MALTNPQVEKILREYDRRRAAAKDDQERRINEAYRLCPGLRETEREISDIFFERVRRRLVPKGQEAETPADAKAGVQADPAPGRSVSAVGAGVKAGAPEAVGAGVKAGAPEAVEAGVPESTPADEPGSAPTREDAAPGDLTERLSLLKNRRRELLAAAGLEPDQLELRYICPDCRDTGYVNGKKCRCFRRLETEILLSEQPARARLAEDTFDNFRLDYYEGEPQGDDEQSPREHMAEIYAAAVRYAEEFVPGRENLLITGNTGTGKTFLSHCIAGALIERGFSVVLLSSEELFRVLADHAFGRDTDGGGNYSLIMDSDLLVIDDLGTEVNNTLVNSQLLTCMERRSLTGRSTLISTNLSLNEIRALYSERVASRILESYSNYQLYNYDSDIRLKVRQERQRRRENERQGII